MSKCKITLLEIRASKALINHLKKFKYSLNVKQKFKILKAYNLETTKIPIDSR